MTPNYNILILEFHFSFLTLSYFRHPIHRLTALPLRLKISTSAFLFLMIGRGGNALGGLRVGDVFFGGEAGAETGADGGLAGPMLASFDDGATGLAMTRSADMTVIFGSEMIAEMRSEGF